MESSNNSHAFLGRGTGVQKSLKLINVGNKNNDAQKVNKGFP